MFIQPQLHLKTFWSHIIDLCSRQHGWVDVQRTLLREEHLKSWIKYINHIFQCLANSWAEGKSSEPKLRKQGPRDGSKGSIGPLLGGEEEYLHCPAGQLGLVQLTHKWKNLRPAKMARSHQNSAKSALCQKPLEHPLLPVDCVGVPLTAVYCACLTQGTCVRISEWLLKWGAGAAYSSS